MPCFVNGRPSTTQRAANFILEDDSASSADPIAIAWTAPCECQMQQISWKSDAAPTTSENVTLTRDALAGPTYDNEYLSMDPTIDSIVDWTCLEGFRFQKGDVVKVDYPNSDNNDITVVVYLERIDS